MHYCVAHNLIKRCNEVHLVQFFDGFKEEQGIGQRCVQVAQLQTIAHQFPCALIISWISLVVTWSPLQKVVVGGLFLNPALTRC